MRIGERIIKAVVSNPLTWVSLAIVAALVWGFHSWFDPSLAMSGAAIALGVACIVAWPVLLVRSSGFTQRLYQAPKSLIEEQRDRLEALAEDFALLEFAPGAAQLERLPEKLDNLAEVLKRRLNSGELTYHRYFGMAEQVYLSALDNLHEAAVALRSVSTIDPERLQARLAELGHANAADADKARELEALNKRYALLEEQQQRVAALIAQNESAMTVLDNTAAVLAQTKTRKGQASMDAEAAMAELERLAKRAGSYATAD